MAYVWRIHCGRGRSAGALAGPPFRSSCTRWQTAWLGTRIMRTTVTPEPYLPAQRTVGRALVGGMRGIAQRCVSGLAARLPLLP